MRARRLFLLAVLSCSPALAKPEAWLHIDIKSSDDDGEQVKVQLPLTMIEAVLPAIQSEGLKGGRLKLGEKLESKDIDLKALLKGFRSTQDGIFVKVNDHGEKVRISKEGDYILISADGRQEKEEKAEKVRVRLPLDIVDALAESEGSDLDLTAMIRVLANHKGEDLVTVDDGDDHIKIWIDDRAHED